MKQTNYLKDEYKKCIRQIIQSSEYITNMALEGDIDRVDLYRSHLHTMVDKALQLKKLINNNEYNNRYDD